MTEAVPLTEVQTPRVPMSPALQSIAPELPFTVHLSFEPLFREVERLLDDKLDDACGAYREETRSVLTGLKGTPALRGTIDSSEALEHHRDSIRLLMSFLFPELTEDEIAAQAHAPYAEGPFYATRRYREIFRADDIEESYSTGERVLDHYREGMLFAYRMLFHVHFGVEHSSRVLLKMVRNTTTGLDRFFMIDYNFRFVDVSIGDLQLPPQREFSRLLDMEDLEELLRRIPLDGVVFTGFKYTRYVEVTELHNLSLLKSELVEPDALNSPDRFAKIVDRLRSILQVEDLEAGLTLRYPSTRESRYCTMRSLLRDFEGQVADIESTIYGEPIRGQEPLFIQDLQECDCDSEIVGHLRARRVRSVGLIPLLSDGHAIGVLELTSQRPEELHTSAAMKLADLLPALTIAARREMDEAQSRIDRAIKVHCTAIHPSVEWRFEDAAYRYIRELAEEGQATFEDITFENVHPLYGAMDIRGSSDSRNHAIQADLVEHLDLTRDTLAQIYERHPMPIVDYYDKVLARYRASVTKGLRSGDEIGVIDFLHQRVVPFFEYMREHMPVADGADPVDAYHVRMDPSMRILYDRRKDYEDSVTLINETLSALVDREEEKAQDVFPHYFEKYKTDGVEYNIYVGQAMTRARTFDEVQLQNLRLWQLQLMCAMAKKAEELVPQMRVPLRTTPLVLVHSSPLTIQFRTESKQFEVEGAYNIRYEIIKKRIDKSTIRKTGERLTQPGQLSVIYTQEKEATEYVRYLEYLVEKGCLRGKIERLELEDMQGVSGLRALRAPIVLD